jgi:hypothetical protein
MYSELFFDNRVRERLGDLETPASARKAESPQPQPQAAKDFTDWSWQDSIRPVRSQTVLAKPVRQGSY